MATTEIINTIDNMTTSKYVKKGDKTFIKENMLRIQDAATSKEYAHIKSLIKLMSSSKFQADERKKLSAIKEPVIEIIKKYEEYFNDDENDDDIDDEMTIDDVESRLDEKISHYNRFSKNNPMEGVFWVESRSRFRATHDKIETT